jgi:NAD(P)H-nitrite reductase large subunit
MTGRARTADPAINAVGEVAEGGGRNYAFVAPAKPSAQWLKECLADANFRHDHEH